MKDITIITQKDNQFTINNNELVEFYYVNGDGEPKGFMCSIEHVMLAFEEYSSKFTIQATASFDNNKTE